MQTNQWTISAPSRAECHRPLSPVRRAALALILALAWPILSAPAALPTLFADGPLTAADASRLAAAKTPKGLKRSRLAKLNPQLLTAPASPLRQFGAIAADAPNVTLNLFADKELPVLITKTDFKGEGVFVSYGVVQGQAQSSVILAVQGDVMAGTISLPGSETIQITPAGDGFHQVGEINPLEIPGCGSQEVPRPVIGGGDVVPGVAGDAVVVDVMVIYTAAARAGAGSAAAMNALVDLAVAEANTAYSNSSVALTLNLVYRGEVNYTESGSANTDLTRLQSGSNSQLAAIQTLRNTYGADIVTLVTESMATYAGLAYVMSPVSSGFSPFAFNVVKRQYLTGSYVYAHELGHNMGCQHDRANAGFQGAYDYSYGHHLDVSSTIYRTVMAYAPGTRIPYFSNPDVNYSGVATGIASTATNSANNALSLSNAIPTIASFYSSSSFFNFDETGVSVNEDDGTVTLTVLRTGTAATNTTVAYSTVALTATAGSDYTAASGTLTFATNETSKNIVITLLNNSVVESDETFRVILSSPTGGPVLGPKNSADVTVVDDDIGVTLAGATASVSEGGTNIILTVTRSGGLTNTVEVDYATSDLSATAGADYTTATGTLTFTNGVTTQTITVTVADDSDVETNETFKVTLSNATGGATIVSPTNTVVTIIENDSSLAFTTNAVSPPENGSITLTVLRTGGSAGTVTVDYLTADATATAGDDYTNTSGTLTFTNGQASKTISISLVNDSSVEGDETFNITLTNATGGSILGAYTNVLATIRDNDSVFNFSTNAVETIETVGNLPLTITRTGGTIAAASVRYSATNGTAISASDFKAFSGTVNFAAGETSKTISLGIINDTAVESDETLTVGLDQPTGEGVVGTNGVVTVTITDNDSLIGFVSSTLSVDEAATNVTLTLERTGTLTLTNTIAYAFKAGTATTADYTATNGIATFSPGDTNKTITFAIVDDSLVESNETFQVILSAPKGGALIGGTNIATVTIAETDVGLAFSASTASVAEGGTNIVITVNRTGESAATVTVDFATADLSALADGDYTNTSGTLTFTNGVASQTITIPIVDDSEVETNETFKVTLSNPSGAFILGGSNAVVTILENEATLAFSTNALSVTEAATNLVFTVLRTGGTNTTMTVDYLTADGTAEDGSDYTATSGTLSFEPGQKSKTISVPLTNDSSVEGDETFSLSLTNAASGASLGAFTNVTATILDNDSVFSVAASEVDVSETAGTVTISVLRAGGLVGPANVNYATTNSTATAGSDYTAASGTLKFAAGETNKTFTVKITNDTAYEGDETFTAGLNTPTGEGALGTNAVTTVTIVDNDSTISFETNAVSVAENDGTVTITVVRTGTLSLTNTVPYQFKAGSATTADYTATNGVLVFAVGETNKTITAAIINDGLVETNETFTLTLGTPTGGSTLSGTNVATITITEIDVGLAFSASTASVAEGGTNIVITVNRTGESAATVTVDFATADLSALADGDYTNTSGTLTFTNGVASQTITIPIVDDSEVETNETFKVTLSNPSGAFILGGSNAVVTILENEATLAFSTNALSVTEAATNLVFTVLRTGGTNTTMTVDYLTADGTAEDGSDYTATSGTLSFEPGQKSKTISVPLTNDSSVEGDETFSLSLTNAASGASLGAFTNVTATILDNDSVFSVAASEVDVSETAGTVTISVLRAGGLVGPANVNYATTNSTATAGSDYTAASGTLKFAAGETNKTFTVKITNDTAYEGDETFTAGLNTPTGEGALGTNAVTTVTIVDNDSTISFETNAVSVAENDGTVTITVVRTGTLSLTNTVPYQFKAGSATTADYTATNGVLVFAVGETNKTITAAIINDSLIETNETFTLTLGNPTGGAAIGGGNVATITITENDAAVSFLATSASVWEDATNVVLTVRRTGDTTSTVAVDYATSDLTALADDDYTNTSGTLTFTNGVSSLTVTIPIIKDAVVESNETLKLTLSNPSGGVIAGTNAAVITIRENDTAFKLSATTYSGVEGANAVVTLTRVGNTNTAFAATLLTAYTGDATNTDFTAVNTNLNFSTGQLSLAFSIPLSKDSEVDTNETFEVQIQTADTGFDAVSPTNAVVTIIENTGSIQFATDAVSVLESATSVLINVSRTGGTNNVLTVDYVTADVTATAGADYTATTNTLSFAAGQSTKAISIPLTNDTSVEGDETFTVTISNPGGAVLGSLTVAAVTVLDNDSVIAVATNAVTVAESVGKVSVAITRTGGVAAAATVAYATTNSTATAGSDYTAASGTLTFKAGETNKLISLTILNDTAYETNEVFSLVLSSPTAEATLSTNDTVTLTITDNDSTFSWETNTVSIAEDGGDVTLTVNRAGTLTLTNTIAYAIKPGTAGKADYSGTNGVLTFAPGDTNKSITISIVDDSSVESDETFSVLLSNPTGGALLSGTNTAYVTITEDDIGLGLATSTRTVSEDATNIVLTVNRTGSTSGTVSVDYAFTDVTATNSVDYLGTNGSLSFTNGVTTLTVTLPIVDDSDIEANETLKIGLSNPSGATLVNYTNTTITIIEDDSSIAFTTNAVAVLETATTVTLTVKRTGGTNSTVTVDFLTADGAAEDGSDYTATNATLTFDPGQASKTITVPLSNDTSVEGDETFSLSLTNLTGSAVILGSHTNATVTIRDNDSVFAVLTNEVSVAENVGTATLSIRRTGGVVGAASVQYTTANGTATAGSDYTAATGTLNFKPGETNKTVGVRITNDIDAEGDETLTLTLSSPTGEATVGTNSVTTLTILDNDFGVGDVVGSEAPITIVSLRWTVDGIPLLTIGGPIGAYVILDASSDLAAWEQIFEERIVTGAVEVTDPSPVEHATRFYRLRAPVTDSVTQ